MAFDLGLCHIIDALKLDRTPGDDSVEATFDSLELVLSVENLLLQQSEVCFDRADRGVNARGLTSVVPNFGFISVFSGDETRRQVLVVGLVVDAIGFLFVIIILRLVLFRGAYLHGRFHIR